MVDKVMRIVIRVLFYIFVILLLVYLFVQMKNIGYLVFADKAKDTQTDYSEMVVNIEEGESLLQIGKDLAAKDIVDNPYIFALTLRCMDGYDEIKAGSYIVKSSAKPSEILEILSGEGDQQTE
ncbi:MAG: endolytic transglycosylase MltG [Clostridiales bacterium]|nr:endolytic transglycosylase MltG [Clostridiales bacterium]